MDNLRGYFPDRDHDHGDALDWDEGDEGDIAPPIPIGQDERRMQVRAYNFWAGLLGELNFPSPDSFEPAGQTDFGPFSVLLDFTQGIENPHIVYLGDKLAAECNAGSGISRLSDVPARSLLSRITDLYLQIIANQAPIGFEAEFVNQRGATILYRGILLPFSSDNETIDFIYGVINWKELADQQTADELLLEIDQALDDRRETPVEERQEDLELTDWADGPIENDGVLDLVHEAPESGDELPMPAPTLSLSFSMPSPEAMAAPFEGGQPVHGADLYDWLASARDFAEEAKACDARTRHALYAAVSMAYDFSLAAKARPEEFAEILEDAGLVASPRAPMVPVVKLVFGIDYDKTRLAEYAAVLDHGDRLAIAQGELAARIAATPGALKALVAEERRLRRGENTPATNPGEVRSERLKRKLRNLEATDIARIPAQGAEFTLLVARRTADGEVVILGEAGGDVVLIEKAARQLLG